MTITNRFFMLAISYTRFRLSFSTECATGYFGKTCQTPYRYPNYWHLYEMKCTCKKQYWSHIKCYQVWKIPCNNAIYCQRLIIEQKSLFWLVLQYVIEISSILSLLNEATTIKNIFQNPLVRILTLLVLQYTFEEIHTLLIGRIWITM